MIFFVRSCLAQGRLGVMKEFCVEFLLEDALTLGGRFDPAVHQESVR